jgi:hypothetical protein
VELKPREQLELIECLEALETALEHNRSMRGMGLRGWTRRLERQSKKEMIEIRQRDGTTRRYPEHELMEAYRNFYERLGAGEDTSPEHPLIEAARNSSDPQRSQSALGIEPPDE